MTPKQVTHVRICQRPESYQNEKSRKSLKKIVRQILLVFRHFYAEVRSQTS